MKGAGVIDELLSQDYASFPRDDPAELARQAKRMVEEDKMRKEEAKERAAAEKREKEAVKKAQAMPVAKKEEPKKDAVPPLALKRMKIQLYFKHLGHKLSAKEPKNLLSMAESEVDALLSSIQAELQSQGGIELAGNLFVGSVAVFEQVNQTFNPFGLMLSGPAASLTGSVVANKEKWDELVKEFAIEYAEWLLMGPGKRLIGFTVQMVNTVDTANKVAMVESINNRRQVPESVKEEAKGL